MALQRIKRYSEDNWKILLVGGLLAFTMGVFMPQPHGIIMAAIGLKMNILSYIGFSAE